jgi:hypothetical protein
MKNLKGGVAMWRVERITNLFVVNNFVEAEDLAKPVKFYVSGDLVAYGDVNEAIEYHMLEVSDWERWSVEFYKLLRKPIIIAKWFDLISIYKLDDYAYLIECSLGNEGKGYRCVKVIKYKDYGEECNELLGYFYVKGVVKIADDDEVQYIVKNLSKQYNVIYLT